MADDDRRAALAGARAARPPAGVAEVGRDLERAVGVQAELDHGRAHADRGDLDADRDRGAVAARAGRRGRDDARRSTPVARRRARADRGLRCRGLGARRRATRRRRRWRAARRRDEQDGEAEERPRRRRPGVGCELRPARRPAATRRPPAASEDERRRRRCRRARRGALGAMPPAPAWTRPAGAAARTAAARCGRDVRFRREPARRPVRVWRRLGQGAAALGNARAGAPGRPVGGAGRPSPGRSRPGSRRPEQPSEPASAGAALTRERDGARDEDGKETVLRAIHRTPWGRWRQTSGRSGVRGGQVRRRAARRTDRRPEGAARPTRTSPSAAR